MNTYTKFSLTIMEFFIFCITLLSLTSKRHEEQIICYENVHKTHMKLEL